MDIESVLDLDPERLEGRIALSGKRLYRFLTSQSPSLIFDREAQLMTRLLVWRYGREKINQWLDAAGTDFKGPPPPMVDDPLRS